MTVGKVKDFSFSHKGSIGRGPVKKFEDGGMYGEGETGPYDINNMKQPPSNVGKGALEGGRLGGISDRQRRMMMMQASKRQAEIAKQAQEQGAMSDMDSRMMERGYKKGGKVAKVMGEFGKGELHSGSKKGPKVTNPKQAVAIALSEAGKSKKGYAEGGMKAEQGVSLPNPSPEKEMFEVYDGHTGDVVGTYGSLKAASRAVDRRDNDYGGYRYRHRPVSKAEGGAVHDDAAEDRKMIKSMIKPSALKKAMGGPAVQMAKSNAIADSMKGQKKTGYADGGTTTPRKQAAFAKRANSVPVAPRAPMIPQQVMPAGALASIGEGGIGVGRARPGQPNVGAIRAAMAKKASMAMPENAPSMMKKGGKVGC
jgi:hypothetical protein